MRPSGTTVTCLPFQMGWIGNGTAQLGNQTILYTEYQRLGPCQPCPRGSYSATLGAIECFRCAPTDLRSSDFVIGPPTTLQNASSSPHDCLDVMGGFERFATVEGTKVSILRCRSFQLTDTAHHPLAFFFAQHPPCAPYMCRIPDLVIEISGSSFSTEQNK